MGSSERLVRCDSGDDDVACSGQLGVGTDQARARFGRVPADLLAQPRRIRIDVEGRDSADAGAALSTADVEPCLPKADKTDSWMVIHSNQILLNTIRDKK